MSYLFFLTSVCICIELALYVLPRAVDSLYMILRDRRLLTGFLYGEVLLFSLSMSIMMYCYEVTYCIFFLRENFHSKS
jgi:hypothetical protein